jgi:hypothetical protein
MSDTQATTTTSSGTLPCYHVTASNGLVYGVAAHGKTEAREFLARRLREDGEGAQPLTATKVATWEADYGTVLCYGEAR